MENNDWFQFVSELQHPSTSTSSSSDVDKPVAERVELPPIPQPPAPMPTPPASSHGSPTDEKSEPPNIVSVSTTFYPGASSIPLPPDLVFLSSDTVFFYVHSSQLLGASTNRWKGLIPESSTSASYSNSEKGKEKERDRTDTSAEVGPVIGLTEPSPVLNVVLHVVYGMSCAHYSPNAQTLLAAADALAWFGVPLTKYAAPGTPFYELLLAQAPTAPLEFYALAGHYSLHELAAPVSAYLLAYSLSEVSDETAERMGALYFKRMMFLHLGRIEALKRLLLPPPAQHPATPECDFIEQKKLTRAWALASAYLAWDARPDLSTMAIESALYSLNEHMSCELCKTSLRDRIKQLVIQWAMVKV